MMSSSKPSMRCDPTKKPGMDRNSKGSADKSLKPVSTDHNPDVARDRVLKKVGLTSKAFIGPAFPSAKRKPKPDMEDSLSEFYKELEKIDTADGGADDPRKHDVHPVLPAENKETSQVRNSVGCYQNNGAQTHTSWNHRYQNEPYHLKRQRPDMNRDNFVSYQNQWNYPPADNRPLPPPTSHRPPFPHQQHQPAFPHPQNLPPRASPAFPCSGKTNHYQDERTVPSFSRFLPPDRCSPPSQGFPENVPPHFDRDYRGGHYDRRSNNPNEEWHEDGKEERFWCDDEYDRPPSFDSERWDQQRHPQPFDHTHTHRPASVLILMRGLPGSGKTTRARELLHTGPGGVILSTDDYFAHKGGYCYNPELLGTAHEWNQSRVKGALLDGRSPIIIDNTNLQAWEMKPYVKMALERGYKVDFCEPDTSWKFDPLELERRNKHGVHQEKIKQMMDRFSFPVNVDIVMSSQEPPRVTQRHQPERPPTIRGTQEFY
ncbi:uncharacterized protein n4bp2l2 [Menidia menidia]